METKKRFYARAGLFFIVCFMASLRGEEVPLIHRSHFIKLNLQSVEHHRSPHICVPLEGRLKTEGGGSRYHLMRISLISKSGLRPLPWVVRVIDNELINSKTRYLFARKDGSRETAGVYEEYFHSLLENIQKKHPNYIAESLNCEEAYGISRSFRRGSTSIAQNAKDVECSEADIDRRNNR